MTSSLQDVGLAVKRLQWLHHREANRRLSSAAGLSLVQWDVLRHLHAQPDASLHALSELTFQSDQSMGELAGRMVGSGLLERVPGPGRAVRHRLTPQGEEAYEQGSGIVDAVLVESLGALTAQERTTLHDLLVRAADTARSRW